MAAVTVLLLALGLAMDATAVALAKGAAAERVRLSDALRISLLFGGFQAAMPVLGWLAGTQLVASIEAWDHWVAFALLVGIGGKMIHDALGEPDAGAEATAPSFAWKTLLVLALATSIDALAAGITLPTLGAPLLPSVAAIGVTAAALSFAGVYLGRSLGARLGKKLDVAGGLMLIGLGVKTVVDHLRP